MNKKPGCGCGGGQSSAREASGSELSPARADGVLDDAAANALRAVPTAGDRSGGNSGNLASARVTLPGGETMNAI